MDDVRERVPVGEVLRVLRAVDDAVPQLDVAALADGHLSHRKEHDAGGGDQAEGREEPRPGDRCAGVTNEVSPPAWERAAARSSSKHAAVARCAGRGAARRSNGRAGRASSGLTSCRPCRHARGHRPPSRRSWPRPGCRASASARGGRPPARTRRARERDVGDDDVGNELERSRVGVLGRLTLGDAEAAPFEEFSVAFSRQRIVFDEQDKRF